MNAGIPSGEEHDLYFRELVEIATRDKERARLELKNRILTRRMAQTE